MRTDIIEHREEIEKWIQERQSKAYICMELRCKPATLEYYLKRMEIVYTGNKGLYGGKKARTKISLDKVLCNNSTYNTNWLRKRLLEEGIKEHRCEKCDATTWLGYVIPLELHHIDGNNTNNCIENIRMLCPNCHATEPFYRGNAKKS
jgi:hypothetical protein